MNSSRRGAAYGFKLESLSKINDTKSRDQKQTLLNYIAHVVEKVFPNVLTFYEDLDIETASSGDQLNTETLIRWTIMNYQYFFFFNLPLLGMCKQPIVTLCSELLRGYEQKWPKKRERRVGGSVQKPWRFVLYQYNIP